MSEPILREIEIPENNSRILVYANGIALLSPEESRVRVVWRENEGEQQMHHVIEWNRLSDADYLRASGIPVSLSR